MTLTYDKKSILLIECKSFFSRFKGFMLCKNIDHAIMFKRCNSIHTFFMKSNIDVIMCDKGFNILYYYKNLGNSKIILPKKNVHIVIELPVNYYDFDIKKKISIK